MRCRTCGRCGPIGSGLGRRFRGTSPCTPAGSLPRCFTAATDRTEDHRRGRAGRDSSRAPHWRAFYGCGLFTDGARLFAVGGDEVVHLCVQRGHLSITGSSQARREEARNPSGLALTHGRRLWAANARPHAFEVDLGADGKAIDIPLRRDTRLASANLATPPSEPDLAAAAKRAEAT